MEIVALLLAWAFALTFVAFTGKPKEKIVKAVPVRVPARVSKPEAPRRTDRRG